jgi:hypothetical protein
VPPRRGLGVVGELHRDRDDQVQLGQVPASPGRTRRQAIEEDRRLLGQERVADPAVGQLTGQLEVARPECRHVDRHRHGRQRGAQRAAGTAGQR